MDPAIWVAIGGVASIVVTTVVAPYVLRRADWARQDAVAAKVSDAAALVEKAATALKADNVKRDENAKLVEKKLDDIHVLADGNLTAANERLDRALVEIKSLTTEVGALKTIITEMRSPAVGAS